MLNLSTTSKLVITSLVTVMSLKMALGAFVNIHGLSSPKTRVKAVRSKSKQTRAPKKRGNGRRSQKVLNIHASAFRDAQSWCRTSGGLKYIQIDPNKGHLFRYICKITTN